MKSTIGFIGLGNMGSGMAKSLINAHFDVLGFDIDEDKRRELTAAGLKTASGLKEVAKSCGVVILCLPHPDASYEVIFKNLLTDDSAVKTIIETSTLTPEIVLDIARRLKELSVEFICAPMIGGKNSAHLKTIFFLVEGQRGAFDRQEEILKAMGNKVNYMGEIPSATLAKLVFNLCRYTNLAVGVEIYRLLAPYGPNMESIYNFVTEQSLDNFGQVWGEDLKDTMTKDAVFKPSQVPKKDLALLSDMARKHGINDGFIKTVLDTYLSMEES